MPRFLLHRGRDVAVCAALTVLAFLQSPGKIVADTKIDLALNPLQWLARSLHLWDPSGSFGQVQNQAYGYLWPMGPFFALGTGIGLPPWAVQRLWWAVLFCVAYLGLVKLAERLGIGSPATRVIAGAVFALSPRILTELGSVSVEAWPSAIAPWVLVPLVGVAKGTTSIRRGVTLSAIAVLCAGGVNATAVFATIPLAFLWLLTIQPARRRIRVLAAWCAAVLGVTAWWIVPLLVLGSYSPPFLDYIETAETTTWVTDPVTVLRGASYWPAWLEGTYENGIPAGYEIARGTLPAIGTVVLAALGLTGLARRGMPYRRVLVAGLMLGFALVGMGHVGQLPGTFSPALREFLDGAGAPLRNVHKFDVLLRLPLALGIAHLLAILLRVRFRVRPLVSLRRAPGVAVASGTVVALLALATPAFAGMLAAPRGFPAVPDYWRTAAAWLNERSDEGRVLVIPGARFPRYTWGDTLDEVTQPLLHGPAAVRSVIPLAPPSTIRMMDAVEFALATGEGSPGLADYLARAGVSYLLVRNDVDYGRALTAAPLLVQPSLARSPGLEQVATFGPPVRTPGPDGSLDELGTEVPALQILRIDRSVDQAVAYPADQVSTVVGGPESLLALADAGLLPPGPTLLAGDLPPGRAAGPVLLTDGLRLRDRSYGSGRDSASTTLTAEQGATAHDFLPEWGPQWTTSVAFLGVADLRASSSWADKNPAGNSRPAHQPYAALDGDPATSWRPQLETGPGQWIEVTLSQPRPISEVTLHFDPFAGGTPTQVTIEAGAQRQTLDATGTSMRFTLTGEAVSAIRLVVEGFTQTVKDGSFGITEVEIPGVAVERTLLVPAPPTGTGPATVVLTAAAATPACFFGPATGPARCTQRVVRLSEDGPTIDRTLTLVAASAYTGTVWARPRAGAALDALLDGHYGGPIVTASSAAFNEPAARPGAVVDGDTGTTWRAAAEDDAPELRFAWPTQQRITGLRLALDGDGLFVAGSPVGAVTVTAGGQTFTAAVGDGGEVVFDRPVTTPELTLRLEAGEPARVFEPYSNRIGSAPVAVSEVTFHTDGGAERRLPDPSAIVDLPCGSGPELSVGGHTVATRLSGTLRELVQRQEIPAVACLSTSDSTGAIPSVGPGTVRVVAAPSDLAVPTRVVLAPDSQRTPSADAVRLEIDEWSVTRRLVTVPEHAGELVLAVRENSNPGWVASLGGVELTPIVVDGWQQGWIIPAGLSGQVELRYAADGTYRAGLLAGALAVLAVVAFAIAPSRRRPGGPGQRPRAGVIVPLVAGSTALLVTGGLLGGILAAIGVAILVYQWRGAPAPDPAGRVGRIWSWLRPWARLAQWLLPAALLMLASAAWLAVYTSNYHAVPQVLGILAVTSLWLSVLVRTSRA